MDRDTGLRSDQTVILTGKRTRRKFDVPLRRVHYVDPERKLRLVFLTNNFQLSPLTIAKLYKSRWQIELFFRWLKQHLRIRRFFGTSANAVKTQIWIALSVYLLAAIVRKRLDLPVSLYGFLQVLGVTIFEKTPIFQLFQQDTSQTQEAASANQLNLLDL